MHFTVQPILLQPTVDNTLVMLLSTFTIDLLKRNSFLKAVEFNLPIFLSAYKESFILCEVY